MKLDEDGFSDVNDVALINEIRDTAYHGADIRPAWIGSRRARTELEDLKGLANWASTHYDYYLNFVRNYVMLRGAVLDIGCGAGQATAMLGRYAAAAIGIDPDEAVIRFANKHNASNRVSFIHGAFPAAISGVFDYIFCIETMEHIEYAKQPAFIIAALDCLAPGGRMFITTPNESTPSLPHIGVWSPQWRAKLETKLGDRIMKRGYFSNTDPTRWLDAGSHHAWVLA